MLLVNTMSGEQESEFTVEPLRLTNRKEELNINGLITDADIRVISEHQRSAFVRIPKKLLRKIITVLDTPLDQEVSLKPLIEVLSVYSPKHGWLCILRKPDRRQSE